MDTDRLSGVTCEPSASSAEDNVRKRESESIMQCAAKCMSGCIFDIPFRVWVGLLLFRFRIHQLFYGIFYVLIYAATRTLKTFKRVVCNLTIASLSRLMVFHQSNTCLC